MVPFWCCVNNNSALKDNIFTTVAVRMLVDVVRHRISVGLQTCSASEYPSAGPEDGMDCLPAGREQLRG